MTHLLHEVKSELDWTTRELSDAEERLAELQALLHESLKSGLTPEDRDALIERIERRKAELDLPQLYSLMSRAARRFSLLTRVFEIASQYADIDDIVAALTDGELFRLDHADSSMDQTIFEIAEALQSYYHGNFDAAADAQLREAWLIIEDAMRAMGRKI